MQLSFITINSSIHIFLRSSELTLPTKSSSYKMMWTKSLNKSMCILFLFSLVFLAATDLVDGHHRRLLQDGDVSNEDHHFQISYLFQNASKNEMIICGFFAVFFLIIFPYSVYLICHKCCIKKYEQSLEPEL